MVTVIWSPGHQKGLVASRSDATEAESNPKFGAGPGALQGFIIISIVIVIITTTTTSARMPAFRCSLCVWGFGFKAQGVRVYYSCDGFFQAIRSLRPLQSAVLAG